MVVTLLKKRWHHVTGQESYRIRVPSMVEKKRHFANARVSAVIVRRQ
jgi:hypothetical protein